MENNREKFWETLAKQVSGNASEEELDWLQQQRNQERDLNDAAQQAEKAWSGAALPENSYEPDIAKGWQRFQMKVSARGGQTATEQKRMPMRTVYGIAASIVLFIVAGVYFITQFNRESWVEVKTAAHETKVVTLADGSSVRLNRNSTLTYPANFQKENRNVRLTGEAFFEVAKAEGKRFTIFAQGTKTEVIGTSFNLRAYENEPVKVQVVTGKVAFAKTADEDAVFLVPGQEGVIGESTAKPEKKTIENPNFRAWETKSLVFTDQKLGTLVTELENYFNIKITLENNALKNCRFTTTFQNPTLEEIMEVLAETGNLKITKTNGRYRIAGTGCQ